MIQMVLDYEVVAQPSLNDEVLEEKSTNIDPVAITQPDFSSTPFLSFNRFFAKSIENAVHPHKLTNQTYTAEEIKSLLSELC